MKHDIKSNVRVVRFSDDTAEESRLGEIGIVVRHIATNMTGDTEEDPLHSVQFIDGSKHSYWYEELEKID